MLSDDGIELLDVYVGADRVLTGSARMQQHAREQAEALVREQKLEQQKRELERERLAVEAQITALRAGLEARREELDFEVSRDLLRESELRKVQGQVSRSRMADKPATGALHPKTPRNGN